MDVQMLNERQKRQLVSKNSNGLKEIQSRSHMN
jgi:hypothetical protein